MSTSKAHILLVEDDVNFGSLLKNYLELSGYQVAWATDGNVGYSRFRQMKFDLCLLDVMMPWRDGFSLAEDIRGVDQAVPIIFLTARSDKADQVRGYRAGADDYLPKPFDSELLLLKIERILKRSQAGEIHGPEQVSLGIYTYYPEKRLLCHGAEEVRLSPKESALLSLLSQYKNQVMPRRKALLDIWKNDDYFTTRSMDVYMARLRKRFKADPGIQIDSLHGEGYFFRVSDDNAR